MGDLFRALVVAIVTACVASAASPSFNISNVLGSYAVIQRNKPAPFWGGAATAGTTISATWVDGKVYSGSSDASLAWRIVFPAAAEETTPFNLTLTSSAGDSVVLTDLLIGDVFFCSGQSNMGAVTVAAMANASAMVQQAADFALLRIFQVGAPSGGLRPPDANTTAISACRCLATSRARCPCPSGPPTASSPGSRPSALAALLPTGRSSASPPCAGSWAQRSTPSTSARRCPSGCSTRRTAARRFRRGSRPRPPIPAARRRARGTAPCCVRRGQGAVLLSQGKGAVS